MTLKRWHGLLVWLLGTIIAIPVIGENLYLGIGIAIAAGILFGIVSLIAHRDIK